MTSNQAQHVLITGASSGLGAAAARELSNAGYTLTVAARSTSQIEQLAQELNQSTQKVFPVTMDVSSWESVESGVGQAFEHGGPFSGVVHCAGIYGPFGPISTVTAEDWGNAIQINLVGTFNVAKAITGRFRDQESTFISLSGGGATKPMPYITSYAASKAGLVRLIESIALESEFANISCIALAPGLLKTQMLDQVLSQDPEIVGTQFHESMQTSASKGEDATERAVEFIAKFIDQPSLRLSGRLLSVLWDPWEDWLKGDYKALDQPDNFTLRRIVHED
jgi:NAD(P)-dependent dehydrogenase (short-subunit alcohol dehydrogenase family)